MRQPYIDAARGLGILLVLTGHALELDLAPPAHFAAWKFIYAFHMPLFFLVAGLATPRLAATPFARTAATALTLIATATILQFLAAPLLFALTPPTSLADALRQVLWPALKLESYALVVTWFLPCLALIRLAAWTLANTTRPRAAVLLAALATLTIAAHSAGIGYFQLRSVLVGLAFFALGQRLADAAPERLPRWACALLLVLSLLVTAATFDANQGCLTNPFAACPGPAGRAFAVLMASGAIGFPPLFALTALSGAAATLCAALLLAEFRPLIGIGRRTLDLLVINGATLVFVQPRLAPHLAGLPPALVIPPLILAQLAAARLARRPLAALFTQAQSLTQPNPRQIPPIRTLSQTPPAS